MKLTFLFSVILLNGILYSQSVYDFTNQFLVDKDGRVHLKYNVDLEYAMNFDDTSYIRMENRDFVFNFQSETPKIYYEKAIYKFSEEKQIRVDIILDTIILLEETFNNEVIRIGKVKKDTIYSTYNITVSNAYGEDSLVTDTMFHLIPIDYWMNDLDGIRYEKGTYKNGKKDGLWKTNLWNSYCIGATLIEQQFENGKLITEKTIGYYKPEKLFLLNMLLNKEWHATRCEFSLNDRLFFDFKTTKTTKRSPTHLDYLYIDKNGTYVEKSYHWCGSCQRKPIESTWSIQQDGKLLLGEYPFYVEYISETELLLENR